MKAHLIILFAAAALLCACNGNKQNDVQTITDSSKATTTTLAKAGIVNEIAQADFLDSLASVDLQGGGGAVWTVNKPTIVTFYGSNGGDNIGTLASLDKIAANYGQKIDVYKINADNSEGLTKALDINTLPYTLFIINGKADYIDGNANEKAMKEEIEKFFADNL